MEFFKAVFRFLTMYDLRKSWSMKKAGDKLFTDSAEGRAAAFDLEQQNLVRDYQQFFEALSQAELAVEQKRNRLKEVAKNRAEAEKALKGTVTAFTKAETNGDAAGMEQAKADGRNTKPR